MARSDNQSSEQSASVRETVESVWIAVVLAFVLRAFVLEAFVIPTGSMAPRLMGQHWQFDCPACKYHYAFGIPHEPGTPSPNISLPLPPSGRRGKDGGAPAICPNCGHQHRFGPEFAYGGDRVLVLKYLYRFSEPRPWDVVVFKNPQDNEQNYIKRLIGLPGQMIEIVHGDVFVRDGKDFNNDGIIDKKDFADPRAEKECPWHILRKKSPRTQQVMWQVIFDNDYQPDQAVWQKRTGKEWKSPWQPHSGSDIWEMRHGGRVFAFDGAEATSELQFANSSRADRERFCPVYAYNQSREHRGKGYNSKVDVCYDLKLSFMFAPKENSNARVGMRISSFSDHFRAWVSMDGSCTLEHGLADKDGNVEWDKKPWDSCQLDRPATGRAYELSLTHVDRQVTLWVDGRAVLSSTEDQYYAGRKRIIRDTAAGAPTPTVSILASGGPAELWHISLMRDVYYTCLRIADDKPGRATTGNPFVLRKFNNKPDTDEFFVLGDNSPASQDSRLWDHHAPSLRPGYRDGTVPRYNMIGRAFFVYWPGGFRLPMLKRLPIVPNVGRMRLIR